MRCKTMGVHAVFSVALVLICFSIDARAGAGKNCRLEELLKKLDETKYVSSVENHDTDELQVNKDILT